MLKEHLLYFINFLMFLKGRNIDKKNKSYHSIIFTLILIKLALF